MADNARNVELIQKLEDPTVIRNTVLLLKRLPHDSKKMEAFRHFCKMICITEPPPGIHQTFLIQHVGSYFCWRFQWKVIRSVCKSWRHAIETARFPSIVPGRTYDLSRPVKFLSRFQKIELYPEHVCDDTISQRILCGCKNLQEVKLHSYYPNQEKFKKITHFMDNLLQNSCKSLKKLEVDMHYELKSPFLQLGEFSIWIPYRKFRDPSLLKKAIEAAKRCDVKYVRISGEDIMGEIQTIANSIGEYFIYTDIDFLQYVKLDATRVHKEERNYFGLLQTENASSIKLLWIDADVVHDWKETLSNLRSLKYIALVHSDSVSQSVKDIIVTFGVEIISWREILEKMKNLAQARGQNRMDISNY